MKDLSVISKALPYTYGFENNALEREGWSLVDCTEGTGIEDNVSHNGNYIFGFLYTTNPPQYLISPQFDGTTGMTVSFYYKNQMDDYPETFQVGYSTTNRSIDAFTWGNKVTANDEDRWRQFKTYFPIGTKYVAIKYTSYDECYLMLDDFSFEAVDGITLDVAKDNSDIFDANKGQVVDVKFKGLTLEADKWNALCLPFDMTAEQIAASPLAGATIHEYVGTDPEGTSATITLSRECTEIEAGFPYVVKFSGKNIVNPTFGTVYIPEHLRGESIGNNRSFIRGTLVPVELEAGDKSKLYWQDEHLYRPESATTVDAFSFYFELDGTGYDNVTTFNVDFGDRLLGDVNGDGAVNIADAVCIVNHVVGKANSTFVEAAADVNNDGVVDIADAVKIVNLVVGKVETLSREQ